MTHTEHRGADDQEVVDTTTDEGVRRHFRTGGLANDTAWGALHDLSQLMVMTATFILLGRTLGKSDYGRYAGLFGIVGPIGGLTWSGIYLAVLQRRLRERDDARTVARKFILLAGVMGAIGSVVGTLVGAATIGGMPVSTIVPLMVAELVLNGVIQVLCATVQADKGFATATRLKLVVLAIRCSTVGLLLAVGQLHYSVDRPLTQADAMEAIRYLGIGYCVGFTVYLALLVGLILPRLGLPAVLGRPGPGTGRLTSKISFPIAVGVLQQDGDKTVLNSYGFHGEAGLYAAAFRVVSMGLMPLRALEGAAFQRFLPHNEDERNEHTRRAFRYSVLALGVSVVIGIGIVICTPLVEILLGKDFAEAESMVPWLLPFLPLTAVSNAPSNGLLGLGKLGARVGVYVGGAVVSLTLYIVLIPVMAEPWKGAVVGTIAGEAFLAVAGWVVLRHFQQQHNRALDERSHTAATWDPGSPPPYPSP